MRRSASCLDPCASRPSTRVQWGCSPGLRSILDFPEILIATADAAEARLEKKLAEDSVGEKES